MRRPALAAASRVAQATGARLLAETFPARHERGAGIPPVDRLAYLAEMAAAQLDGTRHLILAGARAPVSFFAYPGKPSSLVPDKLPRARAGRAGRRHRRARSRRWPTSSSAPLGRCVTPAAAGAPGPAGRRPDRAQRGRGHRRAAAGERDRLRRGEHLGARAARGHRGRAAARLADPDRRRDRPGPAAGGRGRARLPGTAGPRPGGGRQRHVHDLRVVDPRPRATGHHHGHLQQPLLRDLEHGTGAHRRPGRRAGGPEPARPVPARPGLHRPGRGNGRPGEPGQTAAEFAATTAPRARRARAAPHRGRVPPFS